MIRTSNELPVLLTNSKVDISKIDKTLLKCFILNLTEEYLGKEDESLSEYVFQLIVDNINPKEISVNIQNYFKDKTNSYLLKIWEIMIDCQQSTNGISNSLIDYKINYFKSKLAVSQSKIKILECVRNNYQSSSKSRSRSRTQSLDSKTKRKRYYSSSSSRSRRSRRYRSRSYSSSYSK